ncbi:MAG: alpha/beta fold hydrolase [Calditerrivibrio sp.]|nr:alpha/beta fold hydrolase [Calditerrivibrio sp.]
MSNKKAILKWFLIPWVFFLIIIFAVIIMNKKPPYKLERYPELSNVRIDELISIDFKRSISEGVTNEKNHPKYLKGINKTGILLIHGFTASPFEMQELAEYLNKKGYHVYNARIVGHGSKSEHLNKLSYRDWYDSLKYGYYTLKNVCDKVFIVGQSTGALLGLNIAYYNKVDGLVLLSPAFKILDERFNLVPIVQYFVNSIDKEYSDTTNLKEFYYNERSVKGMVNLKYLIDYTWDNVKLLNTPIFIVQSKYDDVVDYNGALKFYNIYHGSKELYLIDNPSVKHILSNFLNRDRDIVFEKIYKWLEAGDAKK